MTNAGFGHVDAKGKLIVCNCGEQLGSEPRLNAIDCAEKELGVSKNDSMAVMGNSSYTLHKNEPNNLDQIHSRVSKQLPKTQKRNGAKKHPQPYECQTCGQVFTQRYKLNYHMVRHSNERQFLCVLCNKSFKRKYEKDNHERMSHLNENKRFKCTFCNYMAYHLTKVKLHERIHTREFNIKCDKCGKGFPCLLTLRSHLITSHGAEPFTCTTCGKTYTKDSSLRAHAKCHSPGYTHEKKFQCDCCGKTFRTKMQLVVHGRSHTGERNFPCERCGKAFSSKHMLVGHLRIHTGERPYVCETCGKGFRTLDILRLHLRTHTGEKPFSCDICSKSFSQRSAMNIHKRNHGGRKPFECVLCKLSFSTKTLLINHLETKKCVPVVVSKK